MNYQPQVLRSDFSHLQYVEFQHNTNYREFQVKMEVLNLIRLFWGWVFPQTIQLIYVSLQVFRTSILQYTPEN